MFVCGHSVYAPSAMGVTAAGTTPQTPLDPLGGRGGWLKLTVMVPRSPASSTITV
jgi:hypothetical protein